MKYTMNVCDFCCGLFSKCVDVCPLVECPYESDSDGYEEAENRFGQFLEAHSDYIKEEMENGNLQPNDEIEFEYTIQCVKPNSVN